MTKPIKLIIALAALCATGASAMAEPAVKLVTVDVARAMANYWKSQQNEQTLRESAKRAEEEAQALQKERDAMIEEYKGFAEKAENNALSNEARQQAVADAQRKEGQIREKEAQMQQFVQNTQRQLNQRRATHLEFMLEDINKVIAEIRKQRSATVVLDTSGRTSNGISAILFSDPGFDVTDEIITELNKSKPADFKLTTPE
jgi:outer membrane protein